ncbi:MAG: hypothetical protein H6510_13400 [Acidobacteria bacterium]|nr:hypothetical protein [Acidobacteriota bacterium]MCB9398802.1 hypothetical protein [Acidobacteriota bacterium]
MKNLLKCASGLLLLAISLSVWAADHDKLVEPVYFSQTLSLQPMKSVSHYLVKVAGPDELYFELDFSGSAIPAIEIVDGAGSSLPDGQYFYEVVGTPHTRMKRRANDDNPPAENPGMVQSGNFRVLNGELVIPSLESQGIDNHANTQVRINKGDEADNNSYPVDDADGDRAQVFATDVIVQGSECVGFDCVNGESFGADTIRLKENNLRIHFNDTSNSGSFPTNDWRIVANDSTNGGASYLAFEDTDAGTYPFRVLAGAGNNAIYVKSGGNVGFGTSTPVLDLHVASGNTPALRLEQNTSSGFAAQTWDVAGNETNFFIRDATNGSTLPFRIRPGAPSSSIYIDTDGDVGLGTASPGASLHVLTSDSTGSIKVEDTGSTFNIQLEMVKNGTPRIRFDDSSVTNSNPNTNAEWDIGLDASQNFIMRNHAQSANVFTLSATGNLSIGGTITTVGGSCGSGCDLVFEPGYDLPSIDEHAAMMWQNKFLPNVGPTLENAPINLSDKVGRILNELETAHIYIEQLHSRIESLEKKLENK